MLSDVFFEYLVKKKLAAIDWIIISAIVLLGIFLTFLLFFISVVILPYLSSLFTIVVVGVWLGCYFLITKRSLEYECILTNSEMDIDKIIAKKRRKRIISFDFREADLVACVKDSEYNGLLKDVKPLDLSGDSDAFDAYFVDIVISGERFVILFRPTTKMIETIKKFNPQNVHIME